MGVLYHLRHPLLALDLIHEHVARDLLLFQSMQRGSREITARRGGLRVQRSSTLRRARLSEDALHRTALLARRDQLVGSEPRCVRGDAAVLWILHRSATGGRGLSLPLAARCQYRPMDRIASIPARGLADVELVCGSEAQDGEATDWLYRAEEMLDGRRLSEACEIFHQAEAMGASPDRCGSGRWMTAMLCGDFEAAWRESDAIRRRGTPDPHRFWNGEIFVELA